MVWRRIKYALAGAAMIAVLSQSAGCAVSQARRAVRKADPQHKVVKVPLPPLNQIRKALERARLTHSAAAKAEQLFADLEDVQCWSFVDRLSIACAIAFTPTQTYSTDQLRTVLYQLNEALASAENYDARVKRFKQRKVRFEKRYAGADMRPVRDLLDEIDATVSAMQRWAALRKKELQEYKMQILAHLQDVR